MFQFRPRLEDHRAQSNNYNSQQQSRVQPGTSEQQGLLPPSNLPRQRVNAEKENHKLQQSTDRLTSLHSKLHQEAEKIRQWKTSTEIEIQHKDKKLDDAMQTIDSLRKSIIELQLQNESTSTKLRETKSYHEETVHKIGTTRDMCNALKEHVVKLESNIARGETDRDELKFLAKERIDQFQDLVLKFQDIEIGSAAKNEETKKKITAMKSEFDRRSESMKEEISVKSSKIASLDSLNKEQGHTIQSLEDQIRSFRNSTTALEETNNELRLKVKEADIGNVKLREEVEEFRRAEKLTLTKVDELKELHEAATKQNVLLEQNIKEEKASFCEAREEFENTSQALEQTIKDLQRDLLHEKTRYGATCEELGTIQYKLESLSSHLDLKEEELKKKRKELTVSEEENKHLRKELQEVSLKLNEKVELTETMNETISKAETQHHELEEENKGLSKQLKGLAEELDTLTKTYTIATADKEQLQEERDELKAELKNKELKTSALTIENDEFKERIKILEKRIETLEMETKNTLTALEAKKRELLQTEKEKAGSFIKTKELEVQYRALQDENSKLTSKNEDLERDINDVRQSLAEFQSSVEDVSTSEKSKNDSLNKQLTTKKKKIETLENKVKSIQNDLTEKRKTIKENQVEIRSLSTELNEEKEISNQYKSELESLREEHKLVKTETEKLQLSLAEQNEKASVAGKNAEACKTELQNCKEEFEVQVKELCNALERYKSDNEKIVEGKNKEISQIKDQLSLKETASEETNILQQSLEDLRKDLIVLQEAKRIAEEGASQKQELISNLQDTLAEKSKVTELLQQQVTQLQEEIRKRTSTNSGDNIKVKQNGDTENLKFTTQKDSKRVTFLDAKRNLDAEMLEESGRRSPKLAKVVGIVTPKTDKTSNIRYTPRLSQGKGESITSRKNKESTPVPEEKPAKKSDSSSTIRNKKRDNIDRKVSNEFHSASNNGKTFRDSSQIKRIERKPREKSALDEEMEQFKQLFPSRKDVRVAGRSQKDLSTPRKSVSHKNKKLLTPKTAGDKVKDTSWFDSDSVFGFEDF